jgi:hypothetical protein
MVTEPYIDISDHTEVTMTPPEVRKNGKLRQY